MKISPRLAAALPPFAIFCGALFLFTVGLGQQEIIGFEARFYLFAQEMWRQGPSWFPTTYNVYYPDYPATATFIIYALAKCAGGLTKSVAVLPTATAAAITVMMTYCIGALRSRLWGWCAVCFLLLTNTFVMEARTISPDQYIAMVTTISFYYVYSASVVHKTQRWWWLPLLLMFGFAVRGPIGLIVPAGVICIYYCVVSDIPRFFSTGFLSAVVLALCCAVLFGLAYHVGGADFVQDVLRMQVSGRLQDASLPWYFYFKESVGAYALSFPLAWLAIGGLLPASNHKAERQFSWAMVAWALVILVGLSFPAGKKIRYILAMAPALALLSAAIFASQTSTIYLKRLRLCVRVVLLLLPMICLVSIFWLRHLIQQHGLIVGIAYRNLVLIFLIIATSVWLAREKTGWLLAGAALSFVCAYIGVVEPINLALNTTRPLVLQIEALRAQRHLPLAFYHANADAMPIKYLVNMPCAETPVFLPTPIALEAFARPGLFLTDPEWFEQLPSAIRLHYRVVLTGKIGHDPIWVFERV